MNDSKFWYLFTAYGFIWLLIVGYVISLVRRQKAVRRELDALKTKAED